MILISIYKNLMIYLEIFINGLQHILMHYMIHYYFVLLIN
jgi:hypothetical protein